MEPVATPTPAPIMDVTPPASLLPPEAALAQPPAETTVPQTPSVETAKPQQFKPMKANKPKTASTTPVLVIMLAVLLFMLLSAAAYYAYTRSN